MTNLRDLGEPRQLVGTRDRITRQLAALHTQGLVRAASPPEPHPLGYRIEWWIKQPEHVQAPRQPVVRPQPVRHGWSPWWLDGRERLVQVAVWASVGATGVVVVVWLLARAVSGVAQAAAGNRLLVALLFTSGVLAGLRWLTRERPARGGGGCSGVTCHCSGCRGH